MPSERKPNPVPLEGDAERQQANRSLRRSRFGELMGKPSITGRGESEWPFRMIEFSTNGVRIVGQDGEEKKVGFEGVGRMGGSLVAASKNLLPQSDGGCILELSVAISEAGPEPADTVAKESDGKAEDKPQEAPGKRKWWQRLLDLF